MTEEEYDRESEFALSIIEKEHRMPTFIDAINYGMQLQKEQMMKEAVEGKVYAVYPSNQVLLGAAFTSTLKYGDKVRIIIVKEDKK